MPPQSHEDHSNPSQVPLSEYVTDATMLGSYAPTLLNQGNCLIAPNSRQLLAVDAQAAQLLNVDVNNIEKHSLNELFPELTKEQWSVLFDQTEASSHSILNCKVKTASSTLEVELRASKLLGSDSPLLLLSITCPQDSPATHQLQCDALTGLPDRRELVSHLSMLRQTTSTKSSPFALLFLDLDDFKSINDQHGHATGDQILCTLATRWQNCLREHDLVARYGGDEFIVALAGIADQQDTQPVVTRLTETTSEPIQVGEEQFIVTVTIGIAISKDNSKSIEELIATADSNMYAEKAKRKS